MLDEAYYWYEQQLPGLGERFLNEVENCFDKLKLTPFYFSFVNENYRQLLVKQFPYKIVFEIIGNNVVVYAVFHASQRDDAVYETAL